MIRPNRKDECAMKLVRMVEGKLLRMECKSCCEWIESPLHSTQRRLLRWTEANAMECHGRASSRAVLSVAAGCTKEPACGPLVLEP